MTKLMFYSHVHKTLAHGRIIVFRGDRRSTLPPSAHAPRLHQIGVILNAFGEARDRRFTVLTLHDGETKETEDDSETIEPVLKMSLYYPPDTIYHRLLVVKAEQIVTICQKTIKVQLAEMCHELEKLQFELGESFQGLA